MRENLNRAGSKIQEILVFTRNQAISNQPTRDGCDFIAPIKSRFKMGSCDGCIVGRKRFVQRAVDGFSTSRMDDGSEDSTNPFHNIRLGVKENHLDKNDWIKKHC